jgi:predicted RNase H-like HicB family nuclease
MADRMLLEVEQEPDGRWLAEVPELPGVMAYGVTRLLAIQAVEALALRALADRLEHGEAGACHRAPVRERVTDWPSTKARRVLAALLRRGVGGQAHDWLAPGSRASGPA